MGADLVGRGLGLNLAAGLGLGADLTGGDLTTGGGNLETGLALTGLDLVASGRDWGWARTGEGGGDWTGW